MPDKKTINAIVLRFRDKGENVVDTIEEHVEYIKKIGCVWWGWWAKDHELSPHDYFSIIDKNITSKSSSFKIFLLHTKTKKLYEAICTEIKYSMKSEDSKILTPNPEATPLYYNKVNAKLWLKFTNISESSQSLLLENHYSFLPDSKHFFSTERKENHLIASFADCKVSRIDEFTLQDRTIWFLRKQKTVIVTLILMNGFRYQIISQSITRTHVKVHISSWFCLTCISRKIVSIILV